MTFFRVLFTYFFVCISLNAVQAAHTEQPPSKTDIFLSSTHVVTREGESFWLSCWTNRSEPTVPAWYRVNGSRIHSGPILHVHSAKLSDAGEYACRMESSKTDPCGRKPVEADPVLVEVLTADADLPNSTESLVAIATGRNLRARVGETVSLECRVEQHFERKDDADLVVRWTYVKDANRSLVQPPWRKTPSSEGDTISERSGLVLENVTIEDAGEYACSVYELPADIILERPKLLATSRPIHISVTRRLPQPANATSNVTAEIGEGIELRCPIDVPVGLAVLFRWGRMGEVLNGSKHEPVAYVLPPNAEDDGNGMLRISELREGDHGPYVCVAMEYDHRFDVRWDNLGDYFVKHVFYLELTKDGVPIPYRQDRYPRPLVKNDFPFAHSYETGLFTVLLGRKSNGSSYYPSRARLICDITKRDSLAPAKWHHKADDASEATRVAEILHTLELNANRDSNLSGTYYCASSEKFGSLLSDPIRVDVLDCDKE
ncbi:hypothetical protein AAVH_26035 [Aphelenchoides avenae]|nr:hypothetical protein AAVH_26035 [Aphelenchus avenae]